MGSVRMLYSHCSLRRSFSALRRDSKSAAGPAADKHMTSKTGSATQVSKRSIGASRNFGRDREGKKVRILSLFGRKSQNLGPICARPHSPRTLNEPGKLNVWVDSFCFYGNSRSSAKTCDVLRSRSKRGQLYGEIFAHGLRGGDRPR